jgi:DNA end-binding protein Ku
VKPYALLTQAMEQEGKVGIAHFVMRTKQYLAAIRPQDGRLLLSTMVYADEINDPASIPELDEAADLELSDKELAMARQLIETLAADFEPEKFHDTYREAVLSMIERKAEGEEIVAPAAALEPEKVVDLMAALEASVTAAKSARQRHPTARDGADEDVEAEPQSAAG